MSKPILHSDLLLIKELVYDKCGFNFANFKQNPESVEYGASTFELNGYNIQHRVAKITPTKTGQFVTIWKRNQQGITEPFDISDDIDFIFITVRNAERLGQFVFPTSVLAGNGIITKNGKQGKRGIRVYPPWDIPTNKQATKTQSWQINYFLDIKDDHSTNLDLVQKLIGL